MRFLKNALKTGIAMKAIDVIRREASKPENQRKARELFNKVSERAKNRGPRR